MTNAIVASIAIAALSTVGDFVWATWVPQHLMIVGLVHGTALFCAIGLVLGVAAGRPGAGAFGGAVIGAAAAATFYLASPLIGYSAMFVVWFGIWGALGLWYGRLAGVSRPLLRGAIAAVASGLAFYAISGIWTPFDPQGWDYAIHFAAWTVAYLPGFAALLIRQ